MKIPQSPPIFSTIITSILEKGVDHFQGLLTKGGSPLHRDKYIHWDKLRHLNPPEGMTIDEYWYLIKSARKNQYQEIPLIDKYNAQFQYMITASMLNDLLWIEKNSS